jgi:hypothetical protein
LFIDFVFDSSKAGETLDAFIVSDAMIFGRGVFGIFSTLEKAVCFKEEFEKESKYFCEIKKLTVIGTYEFPSNIFAAHTYDVLYDMNTLDGLYAKPELAFDAVGEKGLVVEFVIDVPEKKAIKVCGVGIDSKNLP